MPENLLKEKVTSQLLAELRHAHDRFKDGAENVKEYVKALKRLNDFLLDGKWPEELSPPEETRSKSERRDILVSCPIN